jgi:hypothetical protein
MTNSALFYLLTHSARNSLVHKISRLKNPRYLLPFLAGLAYLWFMIGMPSFGSKEVPREAVDIGPAVQAYSVVAVLFFGALAWLFAPNNPTLYMNEAEVTQLCTAPLTRQQIIRYRWARAQLPLLFMALIAGLFALRRSGINPVFAAVGAWCMVNILMLNGIAAALFAGKLKSWGAGRVMRHAPGVLLVCGLLGVFAFNYTPPPTLRQLELLRPWLDHLFNDGPAWYVLWPLRQVTGIAGAQDLQTFARGVGVAGVMLFLLDQFATCLNTPFEEDALALAQNVGRRMEAFRRGGASGAALARLERVKPSRFKLGERGPVWRAMMWKSVLAQTRGVSLRLLVPFGAIAIVLAITVFNSGERSILDMLIVVMGSVFIAMLLIAGPQVLRNDLRAELQRLDYIKSLPIRGKDVLRGEVYGSASLISVMLVLLTFAGVFLFSGSRAITYDMRVVVILSAACVLPPIAALGFALENGGAVLMPSWAAMAPGSGGVELVGRNMLMTILRLILMSLLLLIPGAVLGIAAALVIQFVRGGEHWMLWLLPPVSLVTGAMIMGEVELLLAFFGHRLERLDPSSERF